MQKENLINFFNKQPGNYFRMFANDKLIGSNTSSVESSKPTEEETRTRIEESYEFVKPNEKITLQISASANMQSAATLELYNTANGLKEYKTGTPTISPGMNESSFQAGFNQGYQLGLEAGRQQAENAQIKEQLAELRNGDGIKKGFDFSTIAENLSGTEIGQNILAAVMKKAGLME